MLKRLLILTASLQGIFTIQNSVAQTHVATATKFTNSSVTSISKSFGAGSSTGNLIVVHLSWDNQTRSVSSVTDNKGNTYARINGPTNWHTNYRAELWYAYNIIGGGSPINITATLTGASTSYLQIYMSEYSGILTTNPLDQKSVNTGSTAAVSSGSKTTLYTNELIYGVSIGASGILTTGATFTNRSSANQNIVEDKNAPAAGTYSATFTSTSGNWVAAMATFRTAATLPVDLLSFDTRVTNQNTVKLDWATATETNNEYFEVQRSRDGVDWTVLKKIKGAGNSVTIIRYSAIDNSPLPGLSYYRLKQFDFDGKSKASELRAVRLDSRSNKTIRLYPNPVNNLLSVEGDHAELQDISVTNYAGQAVNYKISKKQDNDSKIILDLSSIPGGIYILKTGNKFSRFYKQ